MENNKRISVFFKLVASMYFILMCYSFIYLFFGLGSKKHPQSFYTALFWILFSIYYFVYFIINLTRFVKSLSKKKDNERKLCFLKRMQQSILRNAILVIGLAFLFTSYTKEVSLLLIFLIVLLYVVFFVGYILERLFITGTAQKKVEPKRLVIASFVNFFILLIPLFLILINIQFDYVYTFSFGYIHYDFSVKYLQKSWYLLQFFEYLFLVVLCIILFQTTSKPTEYQKERTVYFTIGFTVAVLIVILIQSGMTFNTSNLKKFFIDFAKYQLPTIILLIALNIITSLQDKSDAIYPVGLKERKKIENSMTQEEVSRKYHSKDDDDFSGFRI